MISLLLWVWNWAGKRIEGYDAISPTEVKDLLGMNPSRVSGDNVSLTWHFTNIEKYKRVDTDTRMFMLLLIGNLLCPNLGSTVSLHYLWSLRDVDRIGDYDWGWHGLCYGYPNLSKDPTHPKKLTGFDLTPAYPTSSMVGGGLLPSETDFGRSVLVSLSQNMKNPNRLTYYEHPTENF